MSRPNHGPRMHQNNRGVFYITWTENSRSFRVSTRTANLQEAQRVFAGYLIEKEQDAQRRNRMTVGAMIDYYDANHIEQKTVDQGRNRRALQFLRDILGEDRFVDELASDDFTRYRTERKRLPGTKGRAINDATIRRELTIFIAAANFSVRNRKLENKHAPVVDLPPGNASKDRWLTREEAQILLAAAQRGQDRLTTLYRLAAITLSTGKRRGAIEALKWFQVDLKNRVIDFRRPGEPETKKRRGRAPISKWLLPILERAYREKRSEYVLDTAGDRKNAFAKLAIRAGMPDVTSHTMRHTWGTWAAQGGASMWQIAGVLGCSVQTAERNYLHHCPQHLRGVADSVSPEIVDFIVPDALNDARN